MSWMRYPELGFKEQHRKIRNVVLLLGTGAGDPTIKICLETTSNDIDCRAN